VNIDRLWEVWRENPTSHVDPSEANWISGPQAVGEHAFTLPMPGGASFTYTPGDMSDLSKLGYAYDDVSLPPGAPQPLARLQRLGVHPRAAETLTRGAVMAEPKTVEPLGSNQESLRVTGSEARTSVALDAGVRGKVTANLRSARGATPTVPDR